MKTLLKQFFFRFCFWLGILPVRLFQPDELLEIAENKPFELIEFEFRRMSNSIRISKDNSYYRMFLRQFVPNYKFLDYDGRFIARGYGGGSLNTFRKIGCNGCSYFEKVYFSYHSDLKRTMWFQNNIYKLLVGRINGPKVLQIAKGDILSVVCFEFLDLKKPNDNDIETMAIDFTKKLYQRSLDSPILKLEMSFPGFLTDYRSHFEFDRVSGSAKRIFLEKGLDFEAFVKRRETTQKVFTHGDIHSGNIYADSILIDWDSFGIFPIGMDPAFVFYKLVCEGKREIREYSLWVDQNYSNFIWRSHWADFRANFIFFLFVFYSPNLLSEGSTTLEQHFLSDLKSE